MASFSERVTIYIEAKVDNAQKGMQGFKKSVSEAEGASGKFKAAAKGLGDAASTAAGAMLSPAGLAAGAAAVGSAAVKAVGDFTKLGLAIGKVHDATGLSYESASRWVEVADDAGVSAETFTATVGKLEKNLAANKDSFAQWGVEVATAKDGTVDMNQTLLNAIDAINAIDDPIKKQEAGFAIFGKSWSSMAELIGRGSGQLKKDLEGVDLSKVMTGADVASAKGVRDGLDAISDAVDKLSLTFGKALAPAVAKIAPKIGELVTKAAPSIERLGNSFADLADAVVPAIDAVVGLGDALETLHLDQGGLGLLADGLSPLGVTMSDLSLGAIPAMTGAWESMTGAELEGSAALEGTTERLDAVKKASDDSAAAVADHAAETKRAEESNKRYADALQSVIDRLEEDKRVQQERIDAQRAAADAGFAVTKATNDYQDSVFSLNQRVGEALGDQGKIKEAYDETIQSAEAVADAVVRQYEEQVKANGATLTATQRTDAWNSQMLDAAATAKGPLRQAIVDHIAKVNEIPTDVMTNIQAALDRGDIDEANRLLNEASATRTASVKADADDASLAATNKQLDDVAKPRTVKFHAGSIQIGEHGGYFPEGGIAGEAGPEFIRLRDGREFLIDGAQPIPPGTRVTSTRRTRQLLRGRVPSYAAGTRAQPAVARAALDARTVERQIAHLLRARPLRLQAQVVPTTTLVRVNGGG